MGLTISVHMKVAFNRLAICVLEDLAGVFDRSDSGYETLLAAFDHRYDSQRLSAEESLRIVQSIQQQFKKNNQYHGF